MTDKLGRNNIMNKTSYSNFNLTIVANKTMSPVEEYKQEHDGHEIMHFKIALFLLITIIISHIIIFYWKNTHVQSYRIVTTVILYIFSFIYSLNSKDAFTMLNWFGFSICVIYILFLTKYHAHSPYTPRKIYNIFSYAHSISTLMAVLAIILYILFILLSFYNNNDNSKHMELFGKFLYIMILNTALYGILYQDTASIVTDLLFCSRGVHSLNQLPTQSDNNGLCLICGLPFQKSEYENCLNLDCLPLSDDLSLCKLNCDHRFHEKCIRGWCLIGKKDTCPYCFEKCDLRSRFIQPWEKTELYYGDFLLFLRFILAWNPIIVLIVVYVTSWIGWK